MVYRAKNRKKVTYTISYTDLPFSVPLCEHLPQQERKIGQQTSTPPFPAAHTENGSRAYAARLLVELTVAKTTLGSTMGIKKCHPGSLEWNFCVKGLFHSSSFVLSTEGNSYNSFLKAY